MVGLRIQRPKDDRPQFNILKHGINWSSTYFGQGGIGASINQTTTHNLRTLCRDIIDHNPNVVSIYLTGGFAHGEGSVLVEGDEFRILSDYDLVVIVDSWRRQIRLDKTVGERLKNIYVMFGHPIYEVIVWRLKDLGKLPPTKFLHDFQTAKCIYGRPYKDVIPRVSCSEIPASEGLRLLFNRLHGMLIPFSPKLLHMIPRVQQSRHLVFETAKQISGCLEALMILDHTHFPTQKENVDFITKHSSSTFSRLTKKVPEAYELAEQALEYRLRPQRKTERNAVDLWFKSKNMTMVTLQIFLEELYGKNSGALVEMVEDLIDSIPHSRTLNLLATLHNLVRGRISPNYLYKKPLSALLGARVLLLCSVSRDGQLNVKFLEATNRILAEHLGYRICKDDTLDLWMALKEFVTGNYLDPFSPRSRSILKWL